MSIDGQSTKWRRKIAEIFNRLSRVHERYRLTDDRQTDGRATAYSEGEREFTFANKPGIFVIIWEQVFFCSGAAWLIFWHIAVTYARFCGAPVPWQTIHRRTFHRRTIHLLLANYLSFLMKYFSRHLSDDILACAWLTQLPRPAHCDRQCVVWRWPTDTIRKLYNMCCPSRSFWGDATVSGSQLWRQRCTVCAADTIM